MDSRFSRVVRLVLAVVLIAAALLKVKPLLFTSATGAEIAVGPWHTAAITSEFLMGFWLLALGSVFPVLTWRLAASYFAIMTVISARYVWIGEACSCLGELTSSALPSLIIDIAALVGLACVRPRAIVHLPSSVNSRSWSGLGLQAAGMATAIAAATLVAEYTPVRHWMYAKMGYSIVPDRFAAAVEIDNDGDAEVTFAFTNVSARPVSILGFNSTCRCLSYSEPPILFGPGDTRTLVFRVAKKEQVDRTVEHARLFLDTPSPPLEISLHIN